jgi:Recombination endonuclease VII
MVVAKPKPVKKRPCTQCTKPNVVPPARLCPTCKRKNKKAAAERRHDAYVVETYGLSAGEYKLLKEFQGDVCAICKRGKGKSIRLAVDHDHTKTGRDSVRGLLCKRCNHVLLGMIGHDNIDTLKAILLAAIEYLTNPPAQKMGRTK